MHDSSSAPVAPTIYIWNADLEQLLSKQPSQTFSDVLSSDERQRADQYRELSDQRLFVAGRYFQRRVLAWHAKTAAGRLRFRIGINGKPFLSRPPASNLQYSYSRSGSRAMCAVVEDRWIGADIERNRPIPSLSSVVRTACCDRELRWWLGLPDEKRVSAFWVLWTRKEAIAKLAGLGISDGTQSIAVPETLRQHTWQESMTDGGPVRTMIWHPDAGTIASIAITDSPDEDSEAEPIAVKSSDASPKLVDLPDKLRDLESSTKLSILGFGTQATARQRS